MPEATFSIDFKQCITSDMMSFGVIDGVVQMDVPPTDYADKANEGGLYLSTEIAENMVVELEDTIAGSDNIYMTDTQYAALKAGQYREIIRPVMMEALSDFVALYAATAGPDYDDSDLWLYFAVTFDD